MCLCVCVCVCVNIRPFSLSEMHKLQTSGNEVLRKIFGPKEDKVRNLEKITLAQQNGEIRGPVTTEQM